MHPVTVAPQGDVAMALNRMAVSHPEAFAGEDLRLYRDRVSPAEYDAPDGAQKGMGAGMRWVRSGIVYREEAKTVRASRLSGPACIDSSHKDNPVSNIIENF